MKPFIQNVIEKASTVIYDKSEEILLSLTCILSEGHLLIEDVPGVGKTTLVHTLAKLLDFQFSRIQFTNDLLPSDIIGNVIFDQEKKEFKFFEGPLFANLVLADELNRANPRTQSALLQAMEEFQVSQDKITYNLPSPFILIATQNPKTQVGTFQLPESQLDRFLMSLELNYADKESELKIFQGKDARKLILDLKPIISIKDIINYQTESQRVHLSPLIAEYIYNIVNHSRQNSNYSPLSTRSGLALAKAAKSYAYIHDRDFVLPEDVQKIAPAVLGHRLGLSEGVKIGKKMVSEIINQTKIPV
jgi:MoxR-like ATPase